MNKVFFWWLFQQPLCGCFIRSRNCPYIGTSPWMLAWILLMHCFNRLPTFDSFQIKTNFLQLLKDTSEIDRQSKWSDVKKKIDSDSRYKAVDSSSRREDWFRDYVKTLEKVRDVKDCGCFLLELMISKWQTNLFFDVYFMKDFSCFILELISKW